VNTKPWIVAHRGGACLELENSLAAFRRSLSLRVDAVECDIHRTSDGRPLVIHDPELGRLTNGHGRIADWKSVDLRSSVSLKNGETIPTLDELTSLLRNSPSTGLFVELKAPFHPAELTPALSLLPPEQWVVIGSFQRPWIEPFLCEGFRVMWIVERIPEEQWKNLYSEGVHWLGADIRYLEKKDVLEATRNGLKVWTWTANSRREILHALACGVDGIISDNPPAVRSLLPSI
jgi:glycerophosphoryl diester phosphodiesterase